MWWCMVREVVSALPRPSALGPRPSARVLLTFWSDASFSLRSFTFAATSRHFGFCLLLVPASDASDPADPLGLLGDPSRSDMNRVVYRVQSQRERGREEEDARAARMRASDPHGDGGTLPPRYVCVCCLCPRGGDPMSMVQPEDQHLLVLCSEIVEWTSRHMICGFALRA